MICFYIFRITILYFNLKLGIKQSKIGLKFAEQWLLKAKISGLADDRQPDFFEKYTNTCTHAAHQTPKLFYFYYHFPYVFLFRLKIVEDDGYPFYAICLN